MPPKLSSSSPAMPPPSSMAAPCGKTDSCRRRCASCKRVWQLYVAHIFLFIIFFAQISYVARSFENPLFAEEMNIVSVIKEPDVVLPQAMMLAVQPGQHGHPAGLYPAAARLSGAAVAVAAGAFARARSLRRCSMSRPPGLSAGTCRSIRPAIGSSIHSTGSCLFVFGAWCALYGAERLGKPCRSPITLAVGARSISCSPSSSCGRGTVPQLGRFCPATGCDIHLSDRQDQSRRAPACAFHGAGDRDGRRHPARLERLAIALASSR